MGGWEQLGADVSALDDVSREFVRAHGAIEQIRGGLSSANGQDWIRGRYGDTTRSYVDGEAVGGLTRAVATLEELDRKLLQYVSAQRELSTTGGAPCQQAAAPQRGNTLGDVDVDNYRGGTRSIFQQFVTPRMEEEGLAAGSQLRNDDTVPGLRSSDHWVRTQNSYAIDYPTTDGEAAARRLAEGMGIQNWQPDQYQDHYITVDGQRYRVQILWGAAVDHDDHIHVGIRRVD